MAKYTPGSSVKYGTGSYDSQAHKGVGRDQKALSPTAGENNGSGSTLHTRNAIVRDGVSGKGAPKRGYQIDAHTGTHHGPNGQAMGHLDDIRPARYERQLLSEGDGDGAAHTKHIETAPNRGRPARAEHHPAPGGETHKFKYGSAGEAHGYGHSGSQVEGALRHSGHSRGHRIGKR